MCGSNREGLIRPGEIRRRGRCAPRGQLSFLLAATAALTMSSCGQGEWVSVPDVDGAVKSSGAVRAARRLYDGAPPVIPHSDFGAVCSSCHDTEGIFVKGVGFAPASPHENTGKANSTIRCRQCHVGVLDEGLFVGNNFVGLPQSIRAGGRLYEGAPPTIPHQNLMRENCVACHSGPGARAEIVTTHPERTRCRQCHVPVYSRQGILSYSELGPDQSEGS
jgi:nitrate reductase cytochrome c-type subunit